MIINNYKTVIGYEEQPNNNITTDRGLYGTYLSIQGDAGVSGRLSAVNFATNKRSL